MTRSDLSRFEKETRILAAFEVVDFKVEDPANRRGRIARGPDKYISKNSLEVKKYRLNLSARPQIATHLVT